MDHIHIYSCIVPTNGHRFKTLSSIFNNLFLLIDLFIYLFASREIIWQKCGKISWCKRVASTTMRVTTLLNWKRMICPVMLILLKLNQSRPRLQHYWDRILVASVEATVETQRPQLVRPVKPPTCVRMLLPILPRNTLLPVMLTNPLKHHHNHNSTRMCHPYNHKALHRLWTQLTHKLRRKLFIILIWTTNKVVLPTPTPTPTLAPVVWEECRQILSIQIWLSPLVQEVSAEAVRPAAWWVITPAPLHHLVHPSRRGLIYCQSHRYFHPIMPNNCIRYK